MLVNIQPLKRATIFLLVALSVFCVAYASTLENLISHWLVFDGNQSHGLVVLVLTGYLIVQTLRASQPLPLTSGRLGIPLLILLSAIWYVVAAVNIDAFEQLLLLPLLAAIAYSLLGWRLCLKLLPTFGLLVFALPVWDFLSPSLVKIASLVVSELVEASRIPALIEGNSFYLPDGKVDIVGGCSGVKYLTISLFISYYILLTSRSTLLQKIVLMAMAVTLSVLMNWIRIFAIILIAHYSKMQSPLVEDHDTFGWILFAGVLLPLILFGRKFPTKAVTHQQQSSVEPETRQLHPALLVTTCLALIVGPAVFYSADHTPPDNSLSMPFEGLKNRAIKRVNDNGILTVDHAKRFNVYKIEGESTTLFAEVAESWQSSRDEKLVPYIPNLFNRNLWSAKTRETIQLHNGYRATALQIERKPYGDSQFMVYWFSVGSYKTSTYSSAKLLQIPATVFGENLFSLTALRAECQQPDCQVVRREISDLANQIIASGSF